MQPKLLKVSKIFIAPSDDALYDEFEVKIDIEDEDSIRLLGNSKLVTRYGTGSHQVNIKFVTSEALYRSRATLVVEDIDGEIVHSITKPVKWARVQQRDFYRLRVNEELEGCVKMKNRWLKFVTENVSGSGILIKGDEPLNLNDELLVKSDLFKKIGIESLVPVKVKRSFVKDDERFFGLEFISSLNRRNLLANFNLNQPDKVEYYSNRMSDKISSFVLREQLKTANRDKE